MFGFGFKGIWSPTFRRAKTTKLLAASFKYARLLSVQTSDHLDLAVPSHNTRVSQLGPPVERLQSDYQLFSVVDLL